MSTPLPPKQAQLQFECLHGTEGTDPDLVCKRRVQIRLGEDYVLLSLTFMGTYAKATALRDALHGMGSFDVALGAMVRFHEHTTHVGPTEQPPSSLPPEAVSEGPAG